MGSTMTNVVIMDQGILLSRIVATRPEQRKLANEVMEDKMHVDTSFLLNHK